MMSNYLWWLQHMNWQMNRQLDLTALQVILTAYLVVLAFWDWRSGKVPWYLTLPAMLTAGVWQVWQGHWEILGVWLVIFLLWVLRFYGGGDAKVLMFLFALFPAERLIYVLVAVALVAGLPLLWRKYRGQNLVLLAQRAAFRLASGDISPTDEEWLQARPYTWLLALSGIVCLWVYGI
jgi:Flp pilus assembly protein protease CpaA